MIKQDGNRYIVSQPVKDYRRKQKNEKNFLYITNKNKFIVESILYSISTLVKTNDNIGTIYVLEDCGDQEFLRKAVCLWRTQFEQIKTINIKDILKKFKLEEFYNIRYPNRYNIDYDPIVNSKLLIPLVCDMFDCESVLFIDSDMEIKASFDVMFEKIRPSVGLYGLLERDHVETHENQDVITQKLHDNGYDFTFQEKSGSFDYLNTGLLLFHLDYYRRIDFDKRLELVVESFKIKNRCRFDFPEQDTMNLLWTKKCIDLPDYGVFSYKKDQIENAKVVHYIWAGGGKEELKDKIKKFLCENLI